MSKLSVDEIIRRAMEEGKFKDLPGKGKPLNLEENPHEDPSLRMAHHVLRNAGFSLPWIENLREINLDLEARRAALARSWAWREAALIQGSLPDWVEAEWDRAQETFRQQVTELNNRIRSNNLSIPSTRFQRSLIDPEAEIQGVIHSNSKP